MIYQFCFGTTREAGRTLKLYFCGELCVCACRRPRHRHHSDLAYRCYSTRLCGVCYRVMLHSAVLLFFRLSVDATDSQYVKLLNDTYNRTIHWRLSNAPEKRLCRIRVATVGRSSQRRPGGGGVGCGYCWSRLQYTDVRSAFVVDGM